MSTLRSGNGTNPRELCRSFALSGLFPTFRGGPCEPPRRVSRGVLAVTPSRSEEPKLARSGEASPAPFRAETRSGCLPKEAAGATDCRSGRSPSGASAAGSRGSSPGGRSGVNPVSRPVARRPSGPTAAPVPSEPKLLRVPLWSCDFCGRVPGPKPLRTQETVLQPSPLPPNLPQPARRLLCLGQGPC